MHRNVIIFLLMILPFKLIAQKEANVWMFGDNIGLDFNYGLTTLINSNMAQAEGSAVISDKTTGSLLFYSDGIRVWNRNNQLMPNGKGLLGSETSTQSALIVPFPGNEHLYYLFTIKAANDGDSTGLHYSLVDMREDNGLGDIVSTSKNIALLTPTTEKLTAIPHSNGVDYWLITHAWDSDAFYTYLISKEGISPPAITPIGTIHHGGLSSAARGYLKASPNGKKLAAAVNSYNWARPVEVYDFNAATGEISNFINLGNVIGQYGLSFSPDNTKLYLVGDGLYQYDLSLPTIDAIINSRTELIILNQIGSIVDTFSVNTSALQIAPDGRIYSSAYFYSPAPVRLSKLAVINQPNLAGQACDPSLLDIDFVNGNPIIGLPNFIQSTFNGLLPTSDPGKECELSQAIRLYPNPSADMVTVSISEKCFAPYNLRIINSIGQVLFGTYIQQPTLVKIDIQSFASSLYLFEFRFAHSKKIKKLFKTNNHF